nr:nucleoside-diphosphate kinase [Pseudomonadales bacterium]
MITERTLVLVKPDGVQRGIAGEIISRLERTGLQIIGLKLMQISDDLASQHYGEHHGKPFYPGLVS